MSGGGFGSSLGQHGFSLTGGEMARMHCGARQLRDVLLCDMVRGVIHLPHEKAGLALLICGILLSIFGIRGERILHIPGDPSRVGEFRILYILFFPTLRACVVVAHFTGLETTAI